MFEVRPYPDSDARDKPHAGTAIIGDPGHARPRTGAARRDQVLPCSREMSPSAVADPGPRIRNCKDTDEPGAAQTTTPEYPRPRRHPVKAGEPSPASLHQSAEVRGVTGQEHLGARAPRRREHVDDVRVHELAPQVDCSSSSASASTETVARTRASACRSSKAGGAPAGGGGAHENDPRRRRPAWVRPPCELLRARPGRARD